MYTRAASMYSHYAKKHYRGVYPDNWDEIREFRTRTSTYGISKETGVLSFAHFKKMVKESRDEATSSDEAASGDEAASSDEAASGDL